MASRFFVPPEQITGQRFTLLGAEARHAAVVLRKKPGDLIDLFDGRDLSYQGCIESIAPERIEGTILTQQAISALPGTLVLYQALIKGPKWDWLVEKACEVGVSRLVPLLTARTIVKPAKGEVRDRWKRIAMAASKQSGRPFVMEIAAPQTLPAALKGLPSETLALLPWEKETHKTIPQLLAQAASRPSSVCLLIGPEGGWEPDEVALAKRNGVISVSLGPTLLRSETAGLVASALVLSELSEYS